MYDDRITKKARGTDHIKFTCKNHPNLEWSTKNISPFGSRSIFFNGEEGRSKMSAQDFYPTFKQAMQMLMDGKLLDRKDPKAEAIAQFNTDTVAELAARYVKLEEEFVFECACTGGELILHPKYKDMPNVEA